MVAIVISCPSVVAGGGWGALDGVSGDEADAIELTLLGTGLVIGVEPWHEARYVIPILGMVLGNTMNGIALGINTLTREAWDRRGVIEARLILGATWSEAVAGIRAESVRTGLIPIVNAMAVAGVVSLPGMMTGQILSGVEPLVAVRYQIMVMCMTFGSAGLGAVLYLILVPWVRAAGSDRGGLRDE